MGLVKVILHNYGERQANGQPPSSNEMDVSNNIKFEDGIQVEQRRDGLTGIFVDISIPQTFYREAYDLISNLFFSYGLRAYCLISIYKRDNIHPSQWTLRSTFELDFSTVEILADSLSIMIINTDLRSLIASKNSTKFDYPVIRNTGLDLSYERLPLEFYRDMTIVSDTTYTFSNNELPNNPYSITLWPQITINTSKSDLNIKDIYFANTQSFSQISGSILMRGVERRSFLSNQSSQTITVSLNYDFYASYDINLNNTSVARERNIYFIKYISANGYQTFPIGNLTSSPTRFSGNIQIDVEAGYQLGFAMDGIINQGLGNYSGLSYTSLISNFVAFNITFISKASQSNATIRTIRPSQILNRLINSITNGGEDYSASIEWNPDFDDDENSPKLLIAAEEIRGFKDPNYHISFNDFENWIRTLGYVPVFTDDKTLVFKYYETIFSGLLDVDLRKEQVNSPVVNATTEHSYTNIKVGYGEIKYESENGRFNVNGTFDFTTGLVLSTENTLSLISPLRSDNMGLELLLFDRDKEDNNTSDSRSDNDIFVFQCVQTTRLTYDLDDSEVYTFADNANIILRDACLSPQRLIQRWSRYIANSTETCKFTGTNANRNALNTTGDLYSDLRIVKTPLFLPAEIRLDCIYIDELYNPITWPGLIRVLYKNQSFLGYLFRSIRQMGREEQNSLTLMMANPINSENNIVGWESARLINKNVSTIWSTTRVLAIFFHNGNDIILGDGLTKGGDQTDNFGNIFSAIAAEFPQNNSDSTILRMFSLECTGITFGLYVTHYHKNAMPEYKPIGWNGTGEILITANVAANATTNTGKFYHNGYPVVIDPTNMYQGVPTTDSDGSQFSLMTATFAANTGTTSRTLNFVITCLGTGFTMRVIQAAGQGSLKPIGWYGNGTVTGSSSATATQTTTSAVFYHNGNALTLDPGMSSSGTVTDPDGSIYSMLTMTYDANPNTIARTIRFSVICNQTIYNYDINQAAGSGSVNPKPIGWYGTGLVSVNLDLAATVTSHTDKFYHNGNPLTLDPGMSQGATNTDSDTSQWSNITATFEANTGSYVIVRTFNIICLNVTYMLIINHQPAVTNLKPIGWDGDGTIIKTGNASRTDTYYDAKFYYNGRSLTLQNLTRVENGTDPDGSAWTIVRRTMAVNNTGVAQLWEGAIGVDGVLYELRITQNP